MKKIPTQTRLKIKGLVIILICLANSASAFVTTICDNIGSAAHPVWSCMILQNVPCSEVDYIAGMTCSEQYFPVSPVITVLTDGAVLINNKGVISIFASDKINTFLTETVSKIAAADRKKRFEDLLKNGNYKVSPARIEALRKELNAKVIYSPENINTYNPVKGPVREPNAFELALGGGIRNPAAALKTGANIGNGYTFGVNLFLPLIKSQAGKVNYGINLGTHYFAGNKEYNLNSFSPFRITGQNGNPVIGAEGSGSPKQKGFELQRGYRLILIWE